MGRAKLSVLASPTAKLVLRTKEATRLDLARGPGFSLSTRRTPFTDIRSRRVGSQHLRTLLSSRFRSFGRAAHGSGPASKRHWGILNAAKDGGAVDLLTLLGLSQNDATHVVDRASSAIPSSRQISISATQV